MTDYISRQAAMKMIEEDIPITLNPIEVVANILAELEGVPSADVVEVGKPYFYEQGYIFKDFNNGGEHRYFVIERADK